MREIECISDRSRKVTESLCEFARLKPPKYTTKIRANPRNFRNDKDNTQEKHKKKRNTIFHFSLLHNIPPILSQAESKKYHICKICWETVTQKTSQLKITLSTVIQF
ncbi:unnamed protein product [Moneuplotes crassus]|uniref:Uncharacterized protein n=1 Tax=Euplotes crassus TaxID=5936 RepID=A0AAD1Y3P3_EUPCR|nr:unnamed protein product [Moneuplotes crassus]